MRTLPEDVAHLSPREKRALLKELLRNPPREREPAPRATEPQRLLARLLLLLIDHWCRVFYRLEVQGLENLPETGPCVVVMNHPGKLMIDVFAVVPLLRRRMCVGVAPTPPGGLPLQRRKLLFRLLRRGVQLFPHVRVQRGGANPVDSGIALLEVLEQGKPIMLSAEGEVSWDGRLKPARRGAAWLALQSGAPIVPVGLSGTYDVWPRWARRMRLTGRIRVRVGRPFDLGRGRSRPLAPDSLDGAGERLMAEIGRLIDSPARDGRRGE